MAEESSHNWSDDSGSIGKSSVFTSRSLLITLIGIIVGGLVFGLIGYFAENGTIPFPWLEPLFAAPYMTVTIFLMIFGAGLGGLIGSLISAENVARTDGKEDGSEQNANKWISWGIAVIVIAVILSATGYIWVLSAAYGNGADQDTRIGYTLKNVQRIPGDTPLQVGSYMNQMFPDQTLEVPADPLAAAVMAPVASARNQTLVYGAEGAGPADMDALTEESLSLLGDSPVIVIVSEDDPAYALPAAYAAAYFRVPVVPVAEDSIPASLEVALQEEGERAIFVAAPQHLIPDSLLDELSSYGEVERVADENIYKHSLLWSQSRWENFGWGMDETNHFDGYYNFVLANPENPEFAAAGIPMAYSGNYGPLLYTEATSLNYYVDRYFWRLSPDYFAFPSDGPFMNVKVVGGSDSVSYNTQARADLGLEIHSFKDQVTGMSGLAVLGWTWFVIGLFGAIGALLLMPRRLPYSSYYPRLYWPMAILVLGPVGLLAFLLSYHERPVIPGEMPKFRRPPWARAVSATIMSLGFGMSFMIASMYLFQFFGLPLLRTFEFTSVYWLGSPMTTIMWVVMVIPAIILSVLFYMGPMMADKNGTGYLSGLKKATPIVIISMVSASVGMFTIAWYVMMWRGWMTNEDLWLWVTPLWIASAAGFFVALIPNYLMVKAGWKEGEM